jgi:hypothetical protein
VLKLDFSAGGVEQRAREALACPEYPPQTGTIKAGFLCHFSANFPF